MLSISIDLLAGRYHATSWGRAANEGVAEWPPSPWRLARALVSAAWRRGLLPERGDDVDALLQALAAPPRIALPGAVPAHTRHYMPIAGGMKTSLVFDPFVRTDGSTLAFEWEEVTLDRAADSLLSELLGGIGYFGRAEGPCIATSSQSPADGVHSAFPLSSAGDDDDGDVVPVLCLTRDVTWTALSESTGERQAKRLVTPPAGCFVSYLRPREALDPPRRHVVPRPRPRAEMLRFAIESVAPIPLTDAIRLADRFRAAALRRADGAVGESVSLIRGRDHDDGALSEGHRHCHYLVTDEDGDRRCDHLTVWCPAGLDADAVDALDVATLRSWAFDHPVSLVLLDRATVGSRIRTPLGVAAEQWESHTPFLPVRHPKRRGGRLVDGYEEQVLLELRRRGFPEPDRVELIREHRPAWASFRRERNRRLAPGVPALGVRLNFREKVRGPIAIGRHSHFGMGLFLPVD